MSSPASTISLGLWDSLKYQSFKIEEFDLNSPVELLKTEASRKINIPTTTIDLIYSGLILEDTNTLSSYGIKSGSTVHVIKRKIVEPKLKRWPLSEPEIQQLVVAFRSFTNSSGYRAALQRLSRPEVMELVVEATPGLQDDPIAMSMVQDPELIAHMADADTVRRVAEKHPCLLVAADYIASHIHEQQDCTDPAQPGPSTGYSYSLDALSDDEDMEGTREANPLARNTSFNAITAAQLAAAIANATNTAFNTNSAGVANPNPTPITNEMFSSAMQQALVGSRQQGSGSQRAQEGGETVESIRERLQPQLQQMREIGLANDGVNVRALQATGGDVEAAIELVFNGTID